MNEFFDLEGLIRSFFMAIGIGLVVNAIAYFVLRDRPNWSRWKPVLMMAGIGIVLFLTAAIFYLLPSLVQVPNLDGLSRAQAEQVLVTKRLVPDARPQYVVGVEAGRVVPKSQSPSPGLPVRPGTLVSFAVSERGEQPPTVATPPSTLAVSLFEPKAREKVSATRGPDGIYRFSVRGTSSGLSATGFQLLLWVKPVNPPSDVPGWYLQRPPANGINRVETDGSWIGVVQIGNAQWPPHEADILDLAVTIADTQTAKQLMAEAGVIVRVQLVGIKSDTASGVVVTLK